jgi:hypothetical protein
VDPMAIQSLALISDPTLRQQAMEKLFSGGSPDATAMILQRLQAIMGRQGTGDRGQGTGDRRQGSGVQGSGGGAPAAGGGLSRWAANSSGK